MNSSTNLAGLKPIVMQAHGFAETVELRKLPQEPSPKALAQGGALREIPILTIHHGTKTRLSPKRFDPVIQSFAPSLNIPSPSLTFEGVNNHCSCTPPDTNGEVGPSNYVQIVNTHLQVFNKFTGAAQTAVLAINSLFTGLGNPCATTDDGDPVVLYDPLADRWLITQFADVPGGPPFFMSIAVSKTPDPTGAYYLYCFQMPNTDLNDYPKLAVWPDGYYMTDNQFNAAGTAYLGAGMFAFDRAKMLVGDPTASYVYFDLNGVDPNIFGMLPSDLDGPPPPVGTPNYFSYFTSTDFGDPQDGLRMFQFHADFTIPANSTFTERPESPISVAAFTPFSPGTNTIPQSSTSQKLDSLGDRLMHRLQYRNFSSNETLVVTHTVNGDSAQAAIRYYQLRRNLPSGNFVVYDQVTYAPDGDYRWMGSAAMDYLGNLAVGYSVSSGSMFPAIRYAGRLASDPTNGLFEGEATMQTGGGAQTGSNRWGDYSGLTVDPSDDTTFWYTTEYYGSSSSASWQTRIGKFQIATNSPPAPKGTLQGTVTDGGTGLPISNAVVRTTNGFFRVSDMSGAYSMTVPPGTYDMSAFVTGRGTVTAGGINVTNSATTTQDFVFPALPAIITTNGATITSESCTATNGVIDPGETVAVNFSLKNIGGANASNVVATLLATNGVTAPSGPQSYGTLVAGGGTVSEPFTFTASGSCGSNITATLQIQTNLVNLGTVTYSFNLGALTVATGTFANAAAITIPDSGKASPYPSTNTVSALSGTISKVTVTLTNINHTFPDDIDILLVGPSGQSVILMSDTGGSLDLVNVTLTFDDSAASSLPNSSQITSGTYKPTNIGSGDPFPAPASTSLLSTNLSVFTGTNPNGAWLLYVVDDAAIDTGNIAKGWKLTIIASTNTCCVGSTNQPPVINAASISPALPTTTNNLIAAVTSTNDPDGDPITFAYQWQESTNNVVFTNLTAQTSNTLVASITVAGDYYQVIITPNDGQTNGAPFTTASVLVLVDADGNGINDDWEVQYFGHIGVDPNADPDGDGFSNLQEFLAGTDPTDSGSALRITSIAINNPNVVVSFTSCTNKFYDLQFNDDLTTTNWNAAVTNVPGTGVIVPATDTGAASFTNRFYRVRLLP